MKTSDGALHTITAIPRELSPRLPPTSWTPCAICGVAPSVIAANPVKVFATGSSSSTCVEITLCERIFWTSTMGLAPVTVTVSSSEPTFMSALAVAVKPVVSSIPSRR